MQSLKQAVLIAVDYELLRFWAVEENEFASTANPSEINMKTFTKQRGIALGTLGVLSATLLGGSMVNTAQAKSSTWKKVAIGGAAVTGYGLLKGNKKVALIGGLVAAGSYYKYKKDRKRETRNFRTYRRARR